MTEQLPLFDDPTLLEKRSTKRCVGCGTDKPLAQFYQDGRHPGRLRRRCRDCILPKRSGPNHGAKYRAWYERNREKIIERSKASEAGRRLRPKGRAKILLNFASKRAKRLRLALTITPEWVAERLERGRCPLTGFPFDLKSSRGPFTPSLDRIDPRQGYTPENTQVVSLIYNCAKGAWGHAEVVKMALALLKLDRSNSGAA